MAARMALLLVALVAGAGAFKLQEAAKENAAIGPMRKVVTLLENMKKQVIADGEDDVASYEKYECWCKTSENEKNNAIADADQNIADLQAFLEEAAATTAQLKTEIEGLVADIAADKDTLQTATGVRAEDNSAFLASEADMKETLAALKDAVATLAKVQLLQKEGKAVTAADVSQAQAAHVALLQVKHTVEKKFPMYKDVMQRDLFAVLGSFKDPVSHTINKKTMTAALIGEVFLPKKSAVALEQAKAGAMGNPNYWEPSEEEAGKAKKKNGLSGAAAGAKSYNSRSGQIFGVLRAMNDQFLRDLGNAQKEEFGSLVEFQHLRAAKLGEIAEAEKMQKSKETELAELMRKAATAEEDLDKTQFARSEDIEFLEHMKEGCATEANEFEKRTTVRNQEIEALGETLEILTDDEARSLMGKTLSFLQVDAAAQKEAIQDRLAEKAMKRIAKVARKHHNMLLASLAVRVRLDAFTDVKAAMDKMHGDLTKQQEDEYNKNERCKADLDKTEDDIKVGNEEKDDLDERHLQLTNTLQVLNDEIAQLQADGAANEVSLKQAGEARKAENIAFSESISDQRATVNILQKALKRLQEFYTPAQALVQVHHDPRAGLAAEPEKPKAYGKSESSGGALQLLMKVINDAEAAEAEAVVSEQHAQKTYATLVRDTTASIEADRAAVEQKQEEVARNMALKAETEEAQMAEMSNLQKLNDLLGATHLDCDWMMKNFETTQKARKEEMDAIEEAKAILSGANFAR